jgi:hypothetical protein
MAVCMCVCMFCGGRSEGHLAIIGHNVEESEEVSRLARGVAVTGLPQHLESNHDPIVAHGALVDVEWKGL